MPPRIPRAPATASTEVGSSEVLREMFSLGWDAAMSTQHMASAKRHKEAAWRAYLERRTANSSEDNPLR